MLLCSSRDRTWSLHKLHLEELNGKLNVHGSMLGRTDKKTAVHTRLIWSCSWSNDSKYFATGSRDKKVVIWGKRDDSSWGQQGDVLNLADSVTAVSFATKKLEEGYVVAVGLENGAVYIFVWNNSWREITSFDSNSNGHHSTVTKLSFQPNVADYVVASCSSDNSVRITKVKI